MTLDKTKPDLVFHLAGQTSVGLSFELPYESVESILISTLNILEYIYVQVTSNNKLVMRGNDLELGIEYQIPVDVLEESTNKAVLIKSNTEVPLPVPILIFKQTESPYIKFSNIFK